MKRYGAMEMQFQVYVSSVLDGGVVNFRSPVLLRKSLQYQLKRNLIYSYSGTRPILGSF
jgi:hypothetical protein